MGATKYVDRGSPPHTGANHENAPYMHPPSDGGKAIASVPTEIWSTIFHLSLEDDRSMNNTSPSLTRSTFVTLLNITHVHKYWRTILLKDPHFWSTVVICGPTFATGYDQVDILEEWLARSKTLPLTLKIVETQSWADLIADEGEEGSSVRHAAICNFLKKHNSRWRRLDIFFSPMVSANVRLKTLDLGDFPALQCLALRADRAGRNGYSLPQVSITAPNITQIEMIGRVTLVSSQSTSGPQNASHRPYLKARKITIREQPITYFIKIFSSISAATFSITDDQQAEAAVEEIHYTNNSELAVYATFNHDSIILNHLTSFISQIGSPSSCAWLLDHLDCPSLITLDLTIGCGPRTAPPLANISQFMMRNGLRLQVLRLSVEDMQERELLDMLESGGEVLKELHLVNRPSGLPYLAAPFISNETLRKLTLPNNFYTNHQGEHRDCILGALTGFSYVGPTKDLKLSCVSKMIESRTMHRFILKTKSKLAVEEEDDNNTVSCVDVQTNPDGNTVIRFPRLCPMIGQGRGPGGDRQ